MTVGDTQNCIADVQSLVVYSATNSSLPPSVAQISAIYVDSESFQQIICKLEEAQVITAKLSHFRESITSTTEMGAGEGECTKQEIVISRQ